MISEHSSSWVHVSTPDTQRQDGAMTEQISGFFEIAMPISNDEPRGIALQSIRAHIIGLGVFGNNPTLSIHSHCMKPSYVPRDADDRIYIHYRPSNALDAPIWPGIIHITQGDSSEPV